MINRLFAAMAVLVLASFGSVFAEESRAPKRLLFVGQSKGYQHDAVSTAMATLYDLGRSTGDWEATLRTDCGNITKKPLKYEARNLDQFDAVVFFTDGDLDMDDSQKADLLAFVRDDGKGFMGIHSATITFPSWPEYRKMLGGAFDGHPWGQFDAPLIVDAPDFPGFRKLPPAFSLRDEIYQIRDFSPANSRVLLRLDPEKLDRTRKGVRPQNEFPVAWASSYGKGRILYNGLGHRREVWEQTEFRDMWVESTRWVLGLVPGDPSPHASR